MAPRSAPGWRQPRAIDWPSICIWWPRWADGLCAFPPRWTPGGPPKPSRIWSACCVHPLRGTRPDGRAGHERRTAARRRSYRSRRRRYPSERRTAARRRSHRRRRNPTVNTDTQPLYDLAPLVQLMLLGLVIAVGPLAWVWARHRRLSPLRRLQALTLLTLFLTFDLVLFGAFTRLTDSGLGCPDWPGCYGNASPVGAHAEIATAQAALPNGPVTHGKAWVEMLHRYLALGVGVLISVLTLSAWVQHGRARRGAAQPPPISPWWPTATLLWVCLQGAFGALTV